MAVIEIMPLTVAPVGGEMMLTLDSCGATSNASTTIKESVALGFFRPVTSMVKV